MPFCAYCGHDISDMAVACPDCGHPVQPSVASRTAARYAGFWIRFLGVLIDGLIVGFVVGLFSGFRYTSASGTGVQYRVFFDPSRTVIQFAYSWLMLGLNDGRTIGSLVTGVRVANPDGSKVSIGQAAGRQGMAIASAIPLALGFFWMLWDPEKRTWHDIVANTRVFRS